LKPYAHSIPINEIKTQSSPRAPYKAAALGSWRRVFSLFRFVVLFRLLMSNLNDIVFFLTWIVVHV
jgi:hypothetical protein